MVEDGPGAADTRGEGDTSEMWKVQKDICVAWLAAFTFDGRRLCRGYLQRHRWTTKLQVNQIKMTKSLKQC